MNAKIVFLDAYTLSSGDISFDELFALGDVTLYDRTDANELEERAQHAEVIIVNKFVVDENALQLLPHLKYIIVAATGYNNVDIVTCKERGIEVSNIKNYSGDGVTQHVFALMFEAINQVGYYNSTVKAGRWSKSPDFCYYDHSIPSLQGMTIGIIGYGSIGQQVASIARAFGMKVLIHTRNPQLSDDRHLAFVSKDALFKGSDVITLHCPLNENTKEVINKESLGKMKPSAILINTGRGGLINEAALFHALDHGIISMAALDVLQQEPPHPTNPLLYHSKTIITPHIAWANLHSRRNLLSKICICIEAYSKGSVINSVIQ
jgi:glycerate dehydrogenase